MYNYMKVELQLPIEIMIYFAAFNLRFKLQTFLESIIYLSLSAYKQTRI